MRNRLVIGLLVALLSMSSSSAALQPQKERCGTRMPSLEEIEQTEQQITRAKGKSIGRVGAP